MVDDEDWSLKQWKRVRSRIVSQLGIEAPFVGEKKFLAFGKISKDKELLGSLKSPLQDAEIRPWGWNRALCAQLKRCGIPQVSLPSDQSLHTIRHLSHRRVASEILSKIQVNGIIGESFECFQPNEVEDLLQKYGHIVMKAPWSSSGRGLRFSSLDRTPLSIHMGWLCNLLKSQGSVMVEPFYHKVKDFGMEFYADEKGNVNYLGLSLFQTLNGAYTGNLLATEDKKTELITPYVPVNLLNNIKQQICSLLNELLNGQYVGPLGVDMMIVAQENHDGFFLHPCVEINLRRTMGHVALSLTPSIDDVLRVMRIEYMDNHYKLKIDR